MEKLLLEIERRVLDKEGRYAIIGTEFRARRLALKKTLKFLSYKLCSVSYASKIESSDIIPNEVVLREISSRLGMDQKQFDGILGLREAIEAGIKAILYNNIKSLDGLIKNCIDFDNYRSRIFQFLYYANKNNLEAATAMHTELIKLSTTMTNFDFNVFVVIEGIYFFKIGNIVEAFNTLKKAEYLPLARYVKYVLHLYLFYCANVLCSPDTIYYYNFVREELFSIGSYELLDEVQYYLAIYHVKNDSFERASDICNSIKEFKYKNSIMFLIAYLTGASIRSFSRKNIIKAARCIYDYINDQELFMIDIKEYDGFYQLDYSSLLFKYLLMKDDLEKFDYIMTNVANEVSISEDKYIKRFFVDQLWQISKQQQKYKFLYDGYEKLIKGVNKIEN